MPPPASASLNTELDGDAASCRVYAQWLRGFAKAVESLGDGANRVRSESEAAWPSEAGQKLRDVLSNNRGDIDTLEEFFTREAVAVEALAEKFDTVRARLDQARAVAEKGGLTITPTTIEPAPEQLSPQETRGTPPSPELWQKAHTWTDVSATVNEARGIESKAHDDLAAALAMHKNYWQYLKPSGWAWVSTVNGAYTGLHVTAKSLASRSQNSQKNANSALERFNNTEPNTPQRDGAMRDYLKNQGTANRTNTASSGAKALDGNIPGGDLKGVLGKSVKGVGFLSAGATVLQAKDENNKGVPADKAYTKAGATIAATAGVNLAADAAIGATVATTAGAVVATGGTIVVGAAVAAGVGYLVDNYYDDAKHTVKNWVD